MTIYYKYLLLLIYSLNITTSWSLGLEVWPSCLCAFFYLFFIPLLTLAVVTVSSIFPSMILIILKILGLAVLVLFLLCFFLGFWVFIKHINMEPLLKDDNMI